MRHLYRAVIAASVAALLIGGLITGCSDAPPAAAPVAVAAVPPPPPLPVAAPPSVPSASPNTPPAVELQPPGETPNAVTFEPQAESAAAAGAEVADGSGGENGEGEAEANQAGANLEHPFGRRIEIPEFSKEITWLNTAPLSKQDLKGKFVLFDFWTYCCINCIHILPELKKLERKYPNNLVVIGVHSAKFETEKDTDNIREAILRYEIEHPVINDSDHSMWNTFGVNSWPTIILVDPEGNAVASRSGEFKAPDVQMVIDRALPYYREKKLLDEKPLQLQLEADKEPPTPLRFPGKILADEKGNRLFISDSNHNRIVISTLDGKWLDTIGSGRIGRDDGGYQTATFDHPQGCALAGETLYVADTENHMIRKVDLKAKTVTTVAGTGEQASNPWPGWMPGQPAGRQRFVGPPRTTELNSPWALCVHEKDLFIAMAGSHQIWKMPLNESEIGPYAGNAREDIVDGPLLPREPFAGGSSVFAQPSGLSSDGTWLYVADSEGSSIRKVPLRRGLEVGTVVGSNDQPAGRRLFDFGDVDGPRTVAKLQHCLEVVHVDGKLYVADTYNHKIKVVTKIGDTKTLAGKDDPGTSDDPAEFHEPAGLSYAGGKLYVADTNNHLIRTIELATGKVATLTIAGLEAPARQAVAGQ
jgi:thiol-disulfide isomerase/thioredoxin